MTEDVTDFIMLYEITKSCFNAYMDKNNTCTACKPHYEQLNSVYIDMVAKYKDNVCLDLVDTVSAFVIEWFVWRKEAQNFKIFSKIDRWILLEKYGAKFITALLQGSRNYGFT